jgi:hypothetical protein
VCAKTEAFASVSLWVKSASRHRIVRGLCVDKINAKSDEKTVFERSREKKDSRRDHVFANDMSVNPRSMLSSCALREAARRSVCRPTQATCGQSRDGSIPGLAQRSKRFLPSERLGQATSTRFSCLGSRIGMGLIRRLHTLR